MARPAVLHSFSHFLHVNARLVHIYIACSRQVPARRPNQLAPEIVSVSSEGLCLYCQHKNSLLGWLGRQREPRLPHGLGAEQARGFQLCVGSLVRECISQALVLVLRAPHGTFSPATTRSTMQNGRKTNMKTRQQRPAASFAARSKPWSSNAPRPEPGSHNAQRNYQRYLDPARAEALAGNTVGAENYYQHAEHYFRSMSSDRGAT